MSTCLCGLGRSYPTQRQAEKVLGRVQTRRKRRSDARVGTRRGLRLENRTFECPEGRWHLSSQSRRRFQQAVMA